VTTVAEQLTKFFKLRLTI